MFEAVAGRAEIIEQQDVGNSKFLDECLRFHHPRKIRCPHAAVDDRAGDVKTRRDDTLAPQMIGSLPRKFLDDQIELREFLAGKSLLEDRNECSALFRKEREIALRAADIASENHLFPPYFHDRFFELAVAATGYTNVSRHVQGEDRIPEVP